MTTQSEIRRVEKVAVTIEHLPRLKVGHLVTMDYGKPSQQAWEVVQVLRDPEWPIVVIQNKTGDQLTISRRNVGEYDLSIPKGHPANAES